ncbi:hypothetical protein C5613_18975 [Rhodococcus opacus]|uniref:Uncharacterized protein n=1 Tax=Rhodococcus opacus TaxID=37919 RepID=A0A2S8J8X6_RHOOP|nr:hypothetical protein C5613_18975 [Rhodococcus opacus]
MLIAHDDGEGAPDFDQYEEFWGHAVTAGRGPIPTDRSSSGELPVTRPGHGGADVMPLTFERYPSVSFAVSLPSIAHPLPPR